MESYGCCCELPSIGAERERVQEDDDGSQCDPKGTGRQNAGRRVYCQEEDSQGSRQEQDGKGLTHSSEGQMIVCISSEQPWCNCSLGRNNSLTNVSDHHEEVEGEQNIQ